MGRCERHSKRPKDTTAKARQDKRALPTNSARWRRLRQKVLRREPLCRECRREGRLTPATVVDHDNGDPNDNRLDNLVSLCPSHHARKTAQQDGGFGNLVRP